MAVPQGGMDVLPEENMEDEDVEEGGVGDSIGEEDEDPSELVVLDPSHPLMERVQAALNEQLQKQNEKLEHELQEKKESFKVAQKTREEIGVELYGIQQQLARQQMLIEKEQDNHSAIVQVRHQKEQALHSVRGMHQKMQEQLKEDQEHSSNLRNEMENAAVRLKYLEEAHTTVQQDIALTVRATEKTVSDVSKAQEDKLKQDLYLDRLTRDVEHLEENIALTNMQCQAQAQETKAMKETLAEAAMELEALCFEKKKLMAQWNSSLVGMRRRDEAYFAMVTARNIQQQKIHSTNTELENYKKSIVQEQEHNEQLTLLLHKIETDISHIKRYIDQCEIKAEAYKVDYMTYTRALQETEQSLTTVTGECSIKKNEISALRTQIEREGLEKRRLEDAVMENMMQRLTMDKATQYTHKSLEKLRKSVQQLEMSIALVDNEISQAALEFSTVLSLLKRLEATMEEGNNAILQQNNDISKSEAEIGRNNALIERKQTQIDQMNKKIELKLSKVGGGENLGPWEMRIDELQKQISDSQEECAKMQQHWLRQQNELVKKTGEIDEFVKMTDDLQKKELILLQKKIRLDDELTAEEKYFIDVKHSIETLQKDMVRLNTLITEKKGEHYKLEQSNTLLEKDFISALKEAELEFIQLQAKLSQLREEKERVTNSLVEAEHQIMLWERKIKLAKEMKESVDSDAGQAEIKAMKAEIHRMQVRHSQLQRQQETMIQEMEKAVYRRETIIQRNEAQAKSGKNKQTQGYLKKKIADTARKIKQTQKDISSCDKSIEVSMKTQSDLVNEIQEREASCETAKDGKETMQHQLQETEKSKQMAMFELLMTQSLVKSLTAAKENKYRMLHKTSETRLTEMQRQKEKLQLLWSVVQKIEKEGIAQHPLLDSLTAQITTRLKKEIAEESEHNHTIHTHKVRSWIIGVEGMWPDEQQDGSSSSLSPSPGPESPSTQSRGGPTILINGSSLPAASSSSISSEETPVRQSTPIQVAHMAYYPVVLSRQLEQMQSDLVHAAAQDYSPPPFSHSSSSNNVARSSGEPAPTRLVAIPNSLLAPGSQFIDCGKCQVKEMEIRQLRKRVQALEEQLCRAIGKRSVKVLDPVVFSGKPQSQSQQQPIALQVSQLVPTQTLCTVPPPSHDEDEEKIPFKQRTMEGSGGMGGTGMLGGNHTVLPMVGHNVSSSLSSSSSDKTSSSTDNVHVAKLHVMESQALPGKHGKEDDDTIELVPGTNVFISTARLQQILSIVKTGKQLARKLMSVYWDRMVLARSTLSAASQHYEQLDPKIISAIKTYCVLFDGSARKSEIHSTMIDKCVQARRPRRSSLKQQQQQETSRLQQVMDLGTTGRPLVTGSISATPPPAPPQYIVNQVIGGKEQYHIEGSSGASSGILKHTEVVHVASPYQFTSHHNIHQLDTTTTTSGSLTDEEDEEEEEEEEEESERVLSIQ